MKLVYGLVQSLAIAASAQNYGFDFVGTDNTIRPYHAPTRCITKHRGKLKIKSCTGDANQQWSYDAVTGQIQSMTGNVCWVIETLNNGAKAKLANCDASVLRQQFDVSTGVVRARHAQNLCLLSKDIAYKPLSIKAKKCVVKMFAQEQEGMVNAGASPESIQIQVKSVNGLTDRNEFPEPFKTTQLCAKATYPAASNSYRRRRSYPTDQLWSDDIFCQRALAQGNTAVAAICSDEGYNAALPAGLYCSGLVGDELLPYCNQYANCEQNGDTCVTKTDASSDAGIPATAATVLLWSDDIFCQRALAAGSTAVAAICSEAGYNDALPAGLFCPGLVAENLQACEMYANCEFNDDQSACSTKADASSDAGAPATDAPTTQAPITTAAADGSDEYDNDGNTRYCWTIKFVENEGNLPRPELRLNELDNYCTYGNLLDFEFQYPGYYDVSVTVGDYTATRSIRNLYAKREVRDLTDEEWGAFVSAMWTVKTVSTAVGRQLYGNRCPSGKATDYHEHTYFVMMHGTLSSNHTSDQLHFGKMQEFAHQGWNGLLEKALQCVEPSTTLPWFNGVYDKIHYGDPEDISKFVESAIWGPKYYGGGVNHFDDDGSNPHYWVRDGAFADWPIEQTRDVSLCDEIPETFPEFATHCRKFINEGRWGVSDPNEGGFWWSEPSPREFFKYVSRRPFYFYGSSMPYHAIPGQEQMASVLNTGTVNDAHNFITVHIHSWPHLGASGRWGLKDPENLPVADLTAEEYSLLYNTSEIVTRADHLRSSGWLNDQLAGNGLRRSMCYGVYFLAGCTYCTEEGCFCTGKAGCEDGTWTDSEWTPEADAPSPGSTWAQWQMACRASMAEFHRMFGCIHGQAGTFSSNTMANKDPFFYAAHAQTFMFWDLKFQQMHKSLNYEGSPYYGFDVATSQEMDGHRFDSAAAFVDLVPYKEGQTPGQRHLWSEIMEQWGFLRREYRYDVNTEYGFRDIDGFQDYLGNEHLYPESVYEKEIGFTCSATVDIPNFGPAPVAVQTDEECCNSLTVHIAELPELMEGKALSDLGLCRNMDDGSVCWNAMEGDYAKLGALDAITGWNSAGLVQRINQFCLDNDDDTSIFGRSLAQELSQKKPLMEFTPAFRWNSYMTYVYV